MRISHNGTEYPSKISFKLTNRCNLNCDMCYQKKTENSQELTLEEVDRVLGNLESNFRHISLIGGEIFLREDIFDILDLLKDKYKKDCFLTTNGMLVDEDVADRLSRYTNIRGIMISLDGTREVHNRLRGSEYSFDKIIGAAGLLKDRLRVYATCVVHKENIPHMPELVRIVHGVGAYNICFIFPIISDKTTMDATKKALDMGEFEFDVKEEASNDYDFSYELFQTQVKEARKTGKSLGVNVFVLPDFPDSYLSKFYHNTLFREKEMACRAIFWGKIDVNGDLLHCGHFKMSFGNLLESSFEDIWKSDKMRLFRKKLFEDNLLPVCRRCSCRLEMI